MATKAELEAELALLRKQMAEQKEPDQTEHPADEGDAPAAFFDMFKAQGVTSEEIAALWTQLSNELGNLPQNKPLLTAIGAFGLGFVLGRASKH